MGRKVKQTVEYFPHYVADSKTKRILANHWKNDGYAFWFKLLELLCAEDGHYLDLSGEDEWEDFLAYTLVDEETADNILIKLVKLGKIDTELWGEARVIWCQTLVDNLSHAYSKRTISAPDKPDLSMFLGFPARKSPENHISGDICSQKSTNEMKVNDTKVDRDTPPISPPRGDECESGGESLLVKTATDEPQGVIPSTTRKPRKRKGSGTLTEEQQKRFDQFWDVWPNKVSVGQAEITFGKLDPGDEFFAEIIAGVERAKKHDDRFRPGGRMPHPSTWLNARGWKDQFQTGGSPDGEHRQHFGSGGQPAAFIPSTGFRA